jgi:hypothetical protein
LVHSIPWYLADSIDLAVVLGFFRGRLQRKCLHVYSLAQGFTGFEMGNAFFGNRYAFTAAGVATHARRAVVHRKASKAANFNAVPAYQRIIHRIQNSFHRELSIGDVLVFDDMAHYTMVKTTTFNGVKHPAIALLHENGEIETIRTFGYPDFRDRLS